MSKLERLSQSLHFPSLSKQDNRMTASLRSMIGLFQKMFGDHFWENAVLEATHWNYHPHNTDLR